MVSSTLGSRDKHEKGKQRRGRKRRKNENEARSVKQGFNNLKITLSVVVFYYENFLNFAEGVI